MGRDTTTETTTLAPVNCAWAEWRHWSECTKTCGPGDQTRKRSVDTEAENGGKECEDESEETKSCHNKACPVQTPTALPLPVKKPIAAPSRKIDDNTKLAGVAACVVLAAAVGWYFLQQKQKKEQFRARQEEARMEYDPQYYEDDGGAAYNQY